MADINKIDEQIEYAKTDELLTKNNKLLEEQIDVIKKTAEETQSEQKKLNESTEKFQKKINKNIKEKKESSENYKKMSLFFKEGRENFKKRLKARAKANFMKMAGSAIGFTNVGKYLKNSADVIKHQLKVDKAEAIEKIHTHKAIDEENNMSEVLSKFKDTLSALNTIIKNGAPEETKESDSEKSESKESESGVKLLGPGLPDQDLDDKSKMTEKQKNALILKKHEKAEEKAEYTEEKELGILEKISNLQKLNLGMMKKQLNATKNSGSVVKSLIGAGIAAVVALGGILKVGFDKVVQSNNKKRKDKEKETEKEAARRKILKDKIKKDVDELKKSGYKFNNVKDIAEQINKGKINLNDNSVKEKDKKLMIDALKQQKIYDNELITLRAKMMNTKVSDSFWGGHTEIQGSKKDLEKYKKTLRKTSDIDIYEKALNAVPSQEEDKKDNIQNLPAGKSSKDKKQILDKSKVINLKNKGTAELVNGPLEVPGVPDNTNTSLNPLSEKTNNPWTSSEFIKKQDITNKLLQELVKSKSKKNATEVRYNLMQPQEKSLLIPPGK